LCLVCYSVVFMGRETGPLHLLAPNLLTGGKGADLVIRGNVVLNNPDRRLRLQAPCRLRPLPVASIHLHLTHPLHRRPSAAPRVDQTPPVASVDQTPLVASVDAAPCVDQPLLHRRPGKHRWPGSESSRDWADISIVAIIILVRKQ
jgi:hypothetical protein